MSMSWLLLSASHVGQPQPRDRPTPAWLLSEPGSSAERAGLPDAEGRHPDRADGEGMAMKAIVSGERASNAFVPALSSAVPSRFGPVESGVGYGPEMSCAGVTKTRLRPVPSITPMTCPAVLIAGPPLIPGSPPGAETTMVSLSVSYCRPWGDTRDCG